MKHLELIRVYTMHMHTPICSTNLSAYLFGKWQMAKIQWTADGCAGGYPPLNVGRFIVIYACTIILYIHYDDAGSISTTIFVNVYQTLG